MSSADHDAALERLGKLERRDLQGGCTIFTARRFGERSRGLAKLPSLPPEWGLHILKCRSVHTMGMKFPLDLIWLDRDGNVVKVTRDLGPRRQATYLRARTVIEVNAGEADRFLAGLAARPTSS